LWDQLAHDTGTLNEPPYAGKSEEQRGETRGRNSLAWHHEQGDRNTSFADGQFGPCISLHKGNRQKRASANGERSDLHRKLLDVFCDDRTAPLTASIRCEPATRVLAEHVGAQPITCTPNHVPCFSQALEGGLLHAGTSQSHITFCANARLVHCEEQPLDNPPQLRPTDRNRCVASERPYNKLDKHDPDDSRKHIDRGPMSLQYQ